MKPPPPRDFVLNSPWSTVKAQRNILVVLRTATTVSWFAELLPDVIADPRIQITFTIDPGSQFQPGVAEYLESLGGRAIPWESATETRFDLAIAAHRSDGLSRLATPLLILPHGPGYSRTLTQRADPQIPIPRAHDHRGITTVMALASDEDIQHFDRHALPTVRFEVTGDPCLDALRASLPARRRYRQALGVNADQTLVVISSTWGPYGALGQNRHIINQVIGSLPSDEYVVASILHANIWSLHGDWQLRLWLRDALASGLRLISHQKGWRPTIVAADIVIGDHGSVTHYASALSIPVVLATAAGTIELKHNTAFARSHRTNRVFDTKVAADIQIREAITNRPLKRTPNQTEASDATPVGSAARIRALIAELLGIKSESPHDDSPRVCDTPTVNFEQATAHWVHTSIDDTNTDHPIVEVQRTPAHGVVGDYTPACSHHLSARSDCPSTRLLNLADVLYDSAQAPTNTEGFPTGRPATLVAAATEAGSFFYQHGCAPFTVAHRDPDRDVIASAVFALSTQQRAWQTVTIRAGDREATARRV